MLIFFPIGLKDATVNRVPWVCIGIAVVCVAVHLATYTAGAEQRQAEEAKLEELIAYVYERPYLELPEDLQRAFPGLDNALNLEGERAPRGDEISHSRVLEQRQLERLTEELLALRAASPVYRWALVPERGYLQKGLLGYIFLHGDWLHLLGNLFFLYLLGPFLEDKWGRLFFLGFFLAGGAMAGAAQAAFDTTSAVPVVGASGAVAACMGAFAFRFTTRGVRIFYWFLFIFVGTFTVPAWLWTGFWLAREITYFMVLGAAAQIAFMSHIGGFVFGAFVALVLKLANFEKLFIEAGLEAAQGVWRQSPHVERGMTALHAGETNAARAAFRLALQEDPSNHEAAMGLARIAADTGDAAGATRAVSRVLDAAAAEQQDAILRNVLEEFGAYFVPAALRPATAFRVAQRIEKSQPALAVECYRVAVGSEGALAGKALLCAAELLLTRLHKPAEVHDLAERESGVSLSPQQRDHLADLVRRASAASKASYGAEHVHLEDDDGLELALDHRPVPTAAAVDPAALDLSDEVVLSPSAGLDLSTEPPSLELEVELDLEPTATRPPDVLEIDLSSPVPASTPAPPQAPATLPVSAPQIPAPSPQATSVAPVPGRQAPAPPGDQPEGRRNNGEVMPIGAPVIEMGRFVGRFANGLTVQLQQGTKVNLSFDLLSSIAFGVVNECPGRGQRVLVLDLVLPPRAGNLRVLRFFSDGMGLDALFEPGTPPLEALRTLVFGLAERSTVRPPASVENASRGEYPRFETLKDFDARFYG